MRRYLLTLIVITLLLSEIILKLNPEIAFISYSLLIGGCLISLSKEESLDDYGKLIIIFMILPIIRISELFIEFGFLSRTFLVYYILFFLVIFYSIKFKINPGYKRKYIILLPLVMILGASLGILGNILFDFDKYSQLVYILPIIVFSEEVLFRGMIQNLIQKNYGVFSSLFFTSLIYGIFTLSQGIPIALFFFFASFVICTIYHYTKNIYLTMSMSLVFQFFILVL